MEYDPTRMCELLVGLGDVEVLSVDDNEGEPLGVHVRSRFLPASSARGGRAMWPPSCRWGAAALPGGAPSRRRPFLGTTPTVEEPQGRAGPRPRGESSPEIPTSALKSPAKSTQSAPVRSGTCAMAGVTTSPRQRKARS